MNQNAVIEFVDEDIEGDFFKYVDDLTMTETIDKNTNCIIDSSASKPVDFFKPKKIQEGFDSLNDSCQDRGLLVNGKKLSFYQSPMPYVILRPGYLYVTDQQCTPVKILNS